MKKQAKQQLASALGLVALAGGAFFLLNPTALPFFPRCPLHLLTGLYCPGCGSCRALHALAHGHLLAAFQFNPLTISALPLVGYLLARRETVPVKPVWIWLLVGVVLAFGVLRNLPVYPFTLLAPQT